MNKILPRGKLLPYVLSVLLFWMCTGWLDSPTTFASNTANSGKTAISTASTTVVLDDIAAVWHTKEPFVYKGITYVSLREAAEQLGATISWNTKARATEIQWNGDIIQHRPGTKVYTVNQHTIIQAPGQSLSINGSTMVPLRTLTEVLKASIEISTDLSNKLIINVKRDTATVYSDLVQEADEFLIDNHYSGLALIAYKGEVILRKGYGYSGDNKLVSANMPSRIASLTKSFTAAAIMKLVEEGKMNLDDTVSTFIPDFPNGDQLTVHMLLSHTSGLTSNFPRVKGMSLLQTIDAIKDKPLSIEPGSDFKYSNVGYMILGAIIEEVSGLSYGDYISEHFLKPLGMDHTGEATSSTPVIKGYISLDGDWVQAGEYISQSGSGTLYSTLDDLLKWDAALQSEGLLSQASLDKIYTPYTNKNYGYGWMIDGEQAPAVVFHNGSGTGYSTGISRTLGDGLTIILLGNQSGRNTLVFMSEMRAKVKVDNEDAGIDGDAKGEVN